MEHALRVLGYTDGTIQAIQKVTLTLRQLSLCKRDQLIYKDLPLGVVNELMTLQKAYLSWKADSKGT